jgi:KTSC domain
LHQYLGMAISKKAGYAHAANLMTKKQHPAEHIRWREVESSNVEAVGWDSEFRMYARFKGGTIYMYEGVSRQRVVACALAKSVGSYFNQKIKPNYKAVKIA